MKLLLLSLFVFIVEQNNIIASSDVVEGDGLEEKQNESWREKIKKWSKKNWKMLSWILGGLAVAGAGCFAYKKGDFGGGGFQGNRDKNGLTSNSKLSSSRIKVNKEFKVLDLFNKTYSGLFNDREKYEKDVNDLRELYERFFSLSHKIEIFDQFFLFHLFFYNEQFNKKRQFLVDFKLNISEHNSLFSDKINVFQSFVKTYCNTIKDIYDNRNTTYVSLKNDIDADSRLSRFFILFDQFNQTELLSIFNEFLSKSDEIVKNIIKKKENIIFEEALNMVFESFFKSKIKKN